MKKFLFITRLYYPHIGGVERPVRELSKHLVKKGHNVSIITEKYETHLDSCEKVEGASVYRISHPKLPVIGLLIIWYKLFLKVRLFSSVDIIHSFGSFIWILPIRFVFFWKNYFVTFFGWEGKFPLPYRYILLRRLANLLTDKSIADAGFIEKYYGIKPDVLRYPSTLSPKKEVNFDKKERKAIYVGRLDNDTGLKNILEGIALLKNTNVEFCGDGELFEECSKYGKVHGFVDPRKYFKPSLICLSPGHTSIVEAFFYKCLIVTTYNNEIKKDYLLMTPFKNWIVVEKDPEKLAEKIKYYLDHPEKAKPMIEAAYKWVQGQTWEKMADTYEELWGVKK